MHHNYNVEYAIRPKEGNAGSLEAAKDMAFMSLVANRAFGFKGDGSLERGELDALLKALGVPIRSGLWRTAVKVYEYESVKRGDGSPAALILRGESSGYRPEPSPLIDALEEKCPALEVECRIEGDEEENVEFTE